MRLSRTGVAWYCTMSLWPDARSNCGMSSLNAPVSAPTASTFTSAACALAAGASTDTQKAAAAARKVLGMDVASQVLKRAAKHVFAKMLADDTRVARRNV
jgi:hypothetical protein